MSEQDKKQNNPNPDGQQDDKKGDDPKGKTFTQEDFDRQLKKALAERQAKLEQKLEERLVKELEERERQAKLSAEEKEAEERKKREQETANKEREITLRENRADARELLQEKGISTDVVDYLVDVDPDKTKENIEKFEKVYLKAVEEGVNERLKGETPKDKSKGTNNEPKYQGSVVL